MRCRWECVGRSMLGGMEWRWGSTGEIEYLGRMDGEVKVRGMRIEVGEIETVLASHRWVEEAVVELSGEGADQRLVAYVVAGEEGTPSARELRRYVRSKLPEHMVPAGYVRVEEMPLLPSGKVNRRALKIRGFRAELGEIEAVLGEHPAVRAAAVVARDEAPGEQRLVAYAVLHPDSLARPEELRSFLKGKLPDYLLPARFEFLASLPLTSSGQVDRGALPAPASGKQEGDAGYAAPGTELE